MKLKRLSSLVGLLAALLIFTSGRALAINAVAVADAFAFPGGSDTVDVLITSIADYPGAEIMLSYDKTALSTAEANVIMNDAAWNPSWGAPTVVVDTAAGTIKVLVSSLSDVTAKIPQSSSALRLFSVIFEVDSTVSSGSYAITPSGDFLTVDENYDTEELPIASLTAGSLTVQSLYALSVDSVSTGPKVLTPVGINLTNGRAIVSTEFVLAYDSSQVVYGDSIVLNDLYVGGSASPVEVTNYGDSIKVAIYTATTATIPVSNDSRWIAKVYMVTATGASETASNPLTLTANSNVVTTTGAPDYDLVETLPNLVPGNFNIQSPYAVVVGDASAPQGGTGTVNVYLRNSEAIVGYEAELFFDASNFTVTEGDVTINEAIFGTGSVNISSVTTTDSSVKVLAAANAGDEIAANPSSRVAFSVALGVKETATAGYDSINATAQLTQYDTDADDFTDITVNAITKGAFRIQAPYELIVKSRSAGPEAQNVPVAIQMTNQKDIYGAEIVVKYNTAELEYVAGSVSLSDEVWSSGSAPTPEIIVGGDSVKIGLLNTGGDLNKIAGGSANLEILTIGFNLKAALAEGDTSNVTISGTLNGLDLTNYDPVEYTPASVNGYIAVYSDIIPPSAVSNASASVMNTTVSLAWKNPTDADLDYVKITRTNKSTSETVTVVTRDTPVPGANDNYDELNVPSGVYDYKFMVADFNGNMGNIVTIPDVTVGETPPATAVMVRNQFARVGGKAYSKVAITNPADNIRGLSFKVTFDNTRLTLNDITPGTGAAGLAPVSAPDIAAANAAGEIVMDMIDVGGSNPIVASNTIKRVAVLDFTVGGAAGDTVDLTLSDVSLSDVDGNDVVTAVNNGIVVIQDAAATDLNGDGSTNLADLWFYFNMDEMVQFESLAELISDLLARPLPTSLAAVQDATAYGEYRVDQNAALINLATDYEIVAARLTFSYDNAYQFEGIGLNPALAGQVMIKQFVQNGRIYVDVIALGGFVPSEVGEIFSVAFRDTDHLTAGLTLEKIETADRDGIVRIEAAKVNQIALPKAYTLSQNSPNPFNPSTTIKYQVPEGDAARVQIVVYNLRGQKVITLVDELKESGDYSVNWNGQSSSGQRVSSGVYFYRMSAGEFSAMRKMVIVK